MFFGRSRWLAGFLIGASFSSPVLPAFVDPLAAPAVMSPLATSSRMTAVTVAGGRMVAVGPRGQILVSDDLGKTWRQVAVPVSSDLVAVQFPTPDKGWAVGHDGVVLHSADGGLTWTKQLDGRQAVAIMQEHYRKRSDGPEAVKILEEVTRFVDDGADKPFLDVRFLNELDGYVVGAFNLAMHTRDGGKTWEPLIDRTDNDQALHIYSLGSSGANLYAAGEQGLLRRWDRQKERFVSIASPYRGTFFGLLARDATLVAFGMRGNVLRSPDGGRSWRASQSNATDGITGGAILDDGRIVLVTQGGQILASKDDGRSFASVIAKNRMPYFGVAPAGKGAVVVVGARGASVETIE